MNYEVVKSWVKSNYPAIKIFDIKDRPSESFEINLNSGGTLKVDFSQCDNGYGCIVKDTVNSYVYKNYEAIIVVNNNYSDDRNILTLLHELGHYTECQDGNDLYKEVMAWEGCVKHLKSLGIEVDYKDYMRSCLSTYESAFPRQINKRYHLYLKKLRVMDKCDFDKLYNCKNPPAKLYGFENWRKRWKLK